MCISIFGINQNSYAKNIEVIGQTPITIQQNIQQGLTYGQVLPKLKTIQLMEVKLDKAEQAYLNRESKTLMSSTGDEFVSPYPSKKFLGMNKVPVLDQGIHGTCVTFAITGALDAILSKGDYISQLCHLTLGGYLEKKGMGLSGWNGSYAKNVLAQIEQYGVVSKNNQRKNKCGGFKEYPRYTQIKESSYTEPEQFLAMSEKIYGVQFNWKDVYHFKNGEDNLTQVKEAINAGHRLAFAVLIPATEEGTVGAVGRHKTWFYEDSWVLTTAIKKELNYIHSAHEMIITGYDDNAVAVDDNGVKHKGLIKLRNSWGYWVGYYGEFYMAYDYFKLLAYDLTLIE
jgi:hypothetical protein